RRGSLCDRHCSTINNDLGDPGCHQHRPRGPAAVSPPHPEECESCARTTLTAENAVEANKLSNNYKFGFKKWKSHVTARPWEERSDIVKELYSDLTVLRGPAGGAGDSPAALGGPRVPGGPSCAPSIPAGSTVTCGNVLYLLLFGWWLSLLHGLVAAGMFLTVVGAPHGRLCWDLAGYFLWPFGKVIQKVEVKVHPESQGVGGCAVPRPDTPRVPQVPKSQEAGAGESSALLGGPTPGRWSPRCWEGTGYWRRVGCAAWLCLGYPLLALCHGLVCVTAWLLIVTIPGVTPNPPLLCSVLDQPPDLLPLVLVTLLLGYLDSHNHLSSSTLKFSLALLSIMPLSYYIGMAIASISAQSTFAVGAVVNATFGSVTELTFYISALLKGSREGSACYAEVVKAALTGTLVGCVLFIPGLCMVIGGIRHQEQRFNSRSAGVSSALLFLSVGGVFAPTLFSKVYGKLVCGECHNVTQNPLGHYLCHSCHFDLMDSNGTLYYSHVQPLVYTVSLLLPAGYLVGLCFTLKTHSHIYDIHISGCHMPGHHHSAVVHWSRWRALVILLLSTLCMSACADLATEHISPILTNSTISQYFIGVTVLAMVPELPEIVNGIQFALQNNLSLSIEIGNCIAVQVCMLQIPILVLFTIFYPTNFTLVFSDLHVYASMFSVVLMNYTFMDGKCDYFQGTVLVMVYFILLAVYFFAPSPRGC
ncbi:VNX1 protein, partial [Tyrannus savana]|nr:VNX1 protein [Tyrannus savana]